MEVLEQNKVLNIRPLAVAFETTYPRNHNMHAPFSRPRHGEVNDQPLITLRKVAFDPCRKNIVFVLTSTRQRGSFHSPISVCPNIASGRESWRGFHTSWEATSVALHQQTAAAVQAAIYRAAYFCAPLPTPLCHHHEPV